VTANTLKTNGARIRTLRKAHGWRLHELATKAEITYGYLGQIERGVVDGSSWVLRRIATQLGVPLQEIVAEELPDFAKAA
jgi:transcriptional regulator with XRE-family HTH domain